MTAAAKWDHGWPTQPSPEEPQRRVGADFNTAFDVYAGTLPDPDPSQLRAVSLHAASSAIRHGWTPQLADVLGMLGCETDT